MTVSSQPANGRQVSPRSRRIVVFGAGGAHRTEASIARGAKSLGHQSLLIDVPGTYRLLGRFAGRFIRWRIDRFGADTILLTRYAAPLEDRTLAAVTRGRESALWFFDLVDRPAERIVRLGRAAESMFVTCPSQIELYTGQGIPSVKFLPQGCDPTLDVPARYVPGRYRCDASFVGSGQYHYRHELLRAVAETCNLQIRGPGWDADPSLPVAGGAVRGRRFSQIVRGASISLGANATEQQWSSRACTSNRLWKVLGCGGFYLGPQVPEVGHLARGGEHCVWYESNADAVELVRHHLTDHSGRTRIASAGLNHVRTAHTYAHRLELLLRGQGYPL
ncbi:MAG: glycosyltransferase [Gemmatimonadales bacterium]